jgi:hypothetical protein
MKTATYVLAWFWESSSLFVSHTVGERGGRTLCCVSIENNCMHSIMCFFYNFRISFIYPVAELDWRYGRIDKVFFAEMAIVSRIFHLITFNSSISYQRSFIIHALHLYMLTKIYTEPSSRGRSGPCVLKSHSCVSESQSYVS